MDDPLSYVLLATGGACAIGARQIIRSPDRPAFAGLLLVPSLALLIVVGIRWQRARRRDDAPDPNDPHAERRA